MKAKLIALILGLFVVSSFFIAIAQTEDDSAAMEISDCEQAQESIEQKIRSYQANKPIHTLTYQMLYLKIAALAQKADVLEYGTEQLYEDLDELDVLIENFDDSYNNFIDVITTAKDSTCTEESVYARNFAEAKKALSEVRQNIRNIAEFYEEEIRQDILALKKT